MKKILLLVCFIILSYSWELKGSNSDINISTLDLTDNILWAYQDNKWKTSFKIDTYPHLETLKGGEGFWAYNDINITSSSPKNSYELKKGWNLVSAVDTDWNMSKKFGPEIPFAWTYKDNKWYLYSYENKYKYDNTFSVLNIGKGVWIYYIPTDANIVMNGIGLKCNDGKCDDMVTTNTSYNILLKTDKYNSDLKFAFNLYRYSNSTHYKLAFGPFQINESGVTTSNISVCVEKEGVGGSCKKVDNSNISNQFLKYEKGYISVDAQKIASLFDKSIPNTKEKFKMKMYIEGFSIYEFKSDSAFGTLGIDGIGTWVTLNDNKSIEFEMEIK